jgi:hypothetical protein
VNTTELTEHLRTATDGLDVPAAFADTVLRGGRRRRARRRLAVAAGVVAVVATAAGTTVVTLRDDPAAAPVADARLAQPTKGGLAGDQAFLDEVRRVWERDLPSAPEARDRYYDDVRGEPHVLWAGTTPAGRAAVVLQPVYVHPNSLVTEKGPRTAEGLVAVDPGDGRLKLVGTRMIGAERTGQADYYRFGPRDATVLVVDRGRPLHHDIAPEYLAATEEIRFDWRRTVPKDGVAVVTTPGDRNTVSPMVYEGNDPPERLRVGETPVVPTPASLWLHLRLPDPSFRLQSSVLAWGDVMWQLGEPIGKSAESVNATWGFFRYYPTSHEVVTSLWTIAARLPDGRVVILKERQDGNAAPRLVAEVAANADDPDTVRVDGGPVDADAVLPVRFRIPDGGGWIVADKGKELSYRTSPDGAWQPVGRDAALLPANATEVLVDDHFVRL